jgi:hypothetical protein
MTSHIAVRNIIAFQFSERHDTAYLRDRYGWVEKFPPDNKEYIGQDKDKNKLLNFSEHRFQAGFT